MFMIVLKKFPIKKFKVYVLYQVLTPGANLLLGWDCGKRIKLISIDCSVVFGILKL